MFNQSMFVPPPLIGCLAENSHLAATLTQARILANPTDVHTLKALRETGGLLSSAVAPTQILSSSLKAHDQAQNHLVFANDIVVLASRKPTLLQRAVFGTANKVALTANHRHLQHVQRQAGLGHFWADHSRRATTLRTGR